MQRAGASSERTPLVQPTYMFEASMTRRYQKRLRNFQCALCVSILLFLGVALLVTVGYNLSQDFDNDNTTEIPTAVSEIPQTVVPVPIVLDPTATTSTAAPTPVPVAPVGNLTLSLAGPRLKAPAPSFPPASVNITETAPDLQPLLQLKWPLKGRDPQFWTKQPTPAAITTAVQKGKAALQKKAVLESKRKPLENNTPASRAQRAAATGASVKPMADKAYVVEEATKVLINGSIPVNKEQGVGLGPETSSVFPEPPYCMTSPVSCPKSKYRSIDGSCNNLQHPLSWGVSHTPFRRVLPADYGDGISSPRQGIDGAPLPSARDVSVTVHRPSYAHDSQFTVMLAVWGQFVDHDITATALSKGENSSSLSCCDPNQPPHPMCFPVRLDKEDPFYQEYNLTCMEFVRSAPAPTCHFGPRQQMNQATAFIDGSTVYGFAENRTNRLRTFTLGQLKMLKVGARELLPPSMDPNDGCNTVEMNAKGRYCFESGQLKMLKVGARELLPPSMDPNDGCNTVEMNAKGRYCFESGDDRANENLHLTTMHLIWARQHNRLAAILRTLNPTWDDDTTYQEARRILGAQMQHITYSEFLPSILGADVMWALNLTLKDTGFSNKYDPTVDPSIANHFSASAFRFAHTLLPGLIHNANKANGTITYTQLHQMLFNPYALYNDKGSEDSMKSAMETLVHSTDPHVTSELSNHLFERPVATPYNSSSFEHKPGPCGLDLVSLNIQRGRDHGLPSYPAWREHCGLSRPRNFSDLVEIFDEQSMTRICTIYKHVDDIDLYTGALAEDPKGRLLGPTLTCLIADQFLRLKVGDRFWYETGDPEVGFTPEQLQEIRKTTLAGVICANEALLDQAQPRVMEAVGPTNPLVDCFELPQPDFSKWKDGGDTRRLCTNYTAGYISIQFLLIPSLCTIEDLLDQSQHQMIEAVGPTNPLEDCFELPQPDFSKWKDGEDTMTRLQ
ncbi:peroxidase domain-containing protein [Phthorimaea operculella]|nr:peroxidase domain-containing protein [Phthorimaea operculella]